MADGYVTRACDRTRGLSPKRDGQVIVGWRVRYTVERRTFEAPLVLGDGREHFESEAEATNYYEMLSASGIEAKIVPVPGIRAAVRRAPAPSNVCAWHPTVRGSRQVVLGDGDPAWACTRCIETITGIGGDVL